MRGGEKLRPAGCREETEKEPRAQLYFYEAWDKRLREWEKKVKPQGGK